MSDDLQKINSSEVVSSFSGQEVVIAKIALEAATEITRIVGDYAKCRQEQITERQRIRAQLKLFTEQIQAKKEMYLYGIKRHYDFNQALYEGMQSILKDSLEKGDIESMKLTYDFMLNFYNSSENQLKVISGMNDNNIRFIE